MLFIANKLVGDASIMLVSSFFELHFKIIQEFQWASIFYPALAGSKTPLIED
ncbi:hypothetical protein H4683_001002 [Filibacter limicola]|uniref:Uncharacterized protein n=1 Tax=Sporosarcina limicola TaxID=34101 RepID=A0A927MIS8_9BACL|nr:hypothetical protein [Sporosarcina limicola]